MLINREHFTEALSVETEAFWPFFTVSVISNASVLSSFRLALFCGVYQTISFWRIYSER